MRYFDDDEDIKEKMNNEEAEEQENAKADEASQTDQIADTGRSGASMDIGDEDEEQEDEDSNNRRRKDKDKDDSDNKDDKSSEELDNEAKNAEDMTDNAQEGIQEAQGTPDGQSTNTGDLTGSKIPKGEEGMTPDQDTTASQSSPGRETPADAEKLPTDSSAPTGQNPNPLGEGELGPGANPAGNAASGGAGEMGPGVNPIGNASNIGSEIGEAGAGAGEVGAAEGGAAAAESGAAAGSAAAAGEGAAAGGAAAAGEGAAAAGGAAAGAGVGAALVYVAVIVLVIVALIGVAGFFMTMPQFLWNKLKSMAVSFWEGFVGYFVGMDQATVHEDDIKAVAQYLQDMGYDLKGMGFAEDVKVNTRDLKTGKLIDEDAEENQILKIDAPYLNAYLVAENRTYMINNYTFNVADAVASIFKTEIPFSEKYKTWGTGLIQLDEGLTTALSMPFKSIRIADINVGELVDGVKVERSTNTLRIRRLNFDWFNTHNDYTYYSLKGWSGRYGKPFELSLTLHIATMAPDLVKEFCMRDELDAKVNIRLRNSDINGTIKIDGKTIEELEQEGTYDEETLNQLREFENKNISTIKTRIPYISSVTNHWFRNVYFEGTDSIGASGNTDIGVDEDEDDIEDYNEERGPKTQKSKKLSAGDSCYQMGGSTETGEFEYSGSEAPDIGEGKITIDGTYSNGIVQVKDAVRGLTNPVTKGLFKEKYYVYDGTVEKAEKIQRARADKDESIKEEIKMTKESLSAFTILEESETLDAQYIYRDLKELVIELGYFEREDFDKIEKNVLEWPIPKYIPGEWPDRKYEKQVVEYGTLIGCEETVANAYDMTVEDLRKLTGQDKEKKEKKPTNLSGTLFIGDSYIVGLSQAGGIEDAKWECKSGMAANYFLPLIGNLPESARRIFVYLGVNNVRDTQSMINYIDALRAKYPNAKIYVSEVMHMGRNYYSGNPDGMNKAIDEYNAVIKKKCDSTNNVYYIITSEGIVENGYLAHPDSEGIHMTGNDYKVWAENIAKAIAATGDLGSSQTDERFVIDFIEALREVTKTAKEEGFTYGHAEHMPPREDGSTNDDGIKRISCDRMVAWALYKMGYRDQPDCGLTCGDMESYLESKGWKKIEDPEKVQIGDVCFSNPQDEEKTKPGHVFVCAGEGKRFDCGSKERIQLTGRYSGYTEQPFTEPLAGDFMFAYRVTGDGAINSGFKEDEDVIAMCNGIVTDLYADGENIFSEGYLSKQVYGEDMTKEDEERFRPSEQTDEGLRIRIKDASLRNYQLIMYGFDVDDGITVGQELKAKEVIGKTKKSDICLILIDTDKAVVEDIEEYIKVPIKKKGNKNGMRVEEDFDVHDETNFIPDIETFKQMFEGYQNIIDNAEAFMEIQDKYQVNAAFAACVTIAESGGGTAWAAIAPYTYNWFSIKGSYHGKSYTSPTANKGPWRWYPSFAAAVDDFGDLIANGSYYYKQGKYTVNQIGPTYCNEHWSETVNKLMKTAYEKVI